MGDKQEAPAAEGKKGFGWLKAVGGGLGGLLSGAIMMYASPLVDKFVKPAKARKLLGNKDRKVLKRAVDALAGRPPKDPRIELTRA